MSRPVLRRGAARATYLLPVVFVVLLFAAPPTAAVAPSAGPGPASTGPHSARAASPGTPSGATNSTPDLGRFLSTETIAPVPAESESCSSATGPAGSCTAQVNVSSGPSLNRTSLGRYAVAFTAYTNDSGCAPIDRRYTQTLVGVSSSADGASWSAPVYLGAGCDASNASKFPSAWQPSITSLSNGTLVLAYVAYNLSGDSAPDLWAKAACAPSCRYSTDVPAAELVVRESFDGGRRWGPPTVVNRSEDPSLSAEAFVPFEPTITARGSTVYLAWANLSGEAESAALGATTVAAGSSQVHFVRSTNGGRSFSTPVDLPVETAGGVAWATNPDLALTPNGTIELAYDTNLSYVTASYCGGACGPYSGLVSDVVLASSTDGGRSFSLRTVAAGEPMTTGTGATTGGPDGGDTVGPAPVVAAGPGGRELYVAFSAVDYSPYCVDNGQTGSRLCRSTDDKHPGPTQILLANGSSGGGNFTTRVVGSIAAVGSETDLNASDLVHSQRYLPAIAVTDSGAIVLEATVLNGTDCAEAYDLGRGSVSCGRILEVVTESRDGGASWSPAADVQWAPTMDAGGMPVGASAAILVLGSQLYAAWSYPSCPSFNASSGPGARACPFGSPAEGGSVQTEISHLYFGRGLSVAFAARGLPVGASWTIDLLGRAKSSTGPAIGFGGLPNGTTVAWAAFADSGRYGVRLVYANSTAPGVLGLTGSVNVTVAFSTEYLVNVSSDPYYPVFNASSPKGCPGTAGTFFLDDPYCAYANYNLTGDAGSRWLPAGAPVGFGVAPNPAFCTEVGCVYDSVNLTFLSWSGSGAVVTTASSGNLTLNGPVNETANFAYDGWCLNSVTVSCFGSNTTIGVAESGLPAGTGWGVSIWPAEGATGPPSANLTNESLLPVSAGFLDEPVDYAGWSIAEPNGTIWVARGSPAPPVELPGTTAVRLRYSNEPAGSLAGNETVIVEELGLPNGTSYGVTVDGVGYGLSGTAGSFELPAGEASFSASPVYGANGTGEAPVGYDVERFELGGGPLWSNSTGPANVSLVSAAFVEVVYGPIDELWTSASAGGTVAPGSGWHPFGSRVELTASSEPGYRFLGWTGSGPGAVTGRSPMVNVTLGGPVEELGSFAPAAAVRYTISVDGIGLPPSGNVTVEFNGSSYTGEANLTLPAVPAGVYHFAPEVSYFGSGGLERFLPVGVSNPYPPAPGGGFYVAANATISVRFETEWYLLVATAGNGTSDPAPGGHWEASGAEVPISAEPAAGAALDSWQGTGAGSRSGGSTNITVEILGPITETALFGALPPPRGPSYSLSVSESGLPNGTAWGADVGTEGTDGYGPSLRLGSLNGSVELAVPVVPIAPGEEYAPNASAIALTIESNTTVSVRFREYVELDLEAGPGGTAGPSSGWYAAGTPLTLVATPSGPGEVFVGWVGSPYSGRNATVTLLLEGPSNESAVFEPYALAHPSSPAANPGAGLPEAIAVLVGLVLAGLLAAQAASRRSRPPEEGERDGEEPVGTEEPPVELWEGLPPVERKRK